MKALRLTFDIHQPHIFSLILRTDHIPFLKDKYSEDLKICKQLKLQSKNFLNAIH